MTTPNRSQSPDAPPADATRWGFLGAGKMASALIRGMIRAGAAQPEAIVASDPMRSVREALTAGTGVATVGSNAEAARGADVLVLAVKPQSMSAALDELGPEATADRLIVSIAAGVTIEAIASAVGSEPRIVRVMPNTPALVGAGASAYCMGPGTTEADEWTVRRMLESVGQAHRVPETMMDAVTGLSGSGPAFVYAIIEAMSDGGVRVGLPRDVATALAAQTVLGAARMVLETGQHPGPLKDQVTSPGGTTIAGLHALERGGLRAALIDAVQAATLRSTELSTEARERRSDSNGGH